MVYKKVCSYLEIDMGILKTAGVKYAAWIITAILIWYDLKRRGWKITVRGRDHSCLMEQLFVEVWELWEQEVWKEAPTLWFVSVPIKVSETLYDGFDKIGKKQNKEQVPPAAELHNPKKPSTSKESKAPTSHRVTQVTHRNLAEAFKAVSQAHISSIHCFNLKKPKDSLPKNGFWWGFPI